MVTFLMAMMVSCQKDEPIVSNPKDEPKDESNEPQTKQPIIGMWKAVAEDGKTWESVNDGPLFVEFAPNGWYYESGEEDGTRYQIEGNYLKVLEDDGTIFKWVFELSSDNQYLTTYAKSTIKFKRFGSSEKTTQSAKELLRGSWCCKKNAYGSPWDETRNVVCKVVFSAKYITMDWYLGSQIIESGIDKQFKIEDSKIVINGYNYPLDYKLSNDNNTLTIYGLDDDDMAELTFERAK